MPDPKEDKTMPLEKMPEEPLMFEQSGSENDPIAGPELPTSLNDELTERIKENPNRFVGCGG